MKRCFVYAQYIASFPVDNGDGGGLQFGAVNIADLECGQDLHGFDIVFCESKRGIARRQHRRVIDGLQREGECAGRTQQTLVNRVNHRVADLDILVMIQIGVEGQIRQLSTHQGQQRAIGARGNGVASGICQCATSNRQNANLVRDLTRVCTQVSHAQTGYERGLVFNQSKQVGSRAPDDQVATGLRRRPVQHLNANGLGGQARRMEKRGLGRVLCGDCDACRGAFDTGEGELIQGLVDVCHSTSQGVTGGAQLTHDEQWGIDQRQSPASRLQTHGDGAAVCIADRQTAYQGWCARTAHQTQRSRQLGWGWHSLCGHFDGQSCRRIGVRVRDTDCQLNRGTVCGRSKGICRRGREGQGSQRVVDVAGATHQSQTTAVQ